MTKVLGPRWEVCPGKGGLAPNLDMTHLPVLLFLIILDAWGRKEIKVGAWLFEGSIQCCLLLGPS